MPQMFPLLWLILFTMTASALYLMMTTVHFSEKKYHTNSTLSSSFNNHNWKW